MKYVIIGNSAAGINAAEEIGELDKKAKITVISDEKDIVYSRFLISRYLDGRLKEGQLYFKTEDFAFPLKVRQKNTFDRPSRLFCYIQCAGWVAGIFFYYFQ